jgi:spermidine/putrescine transport system ATP-binding protein
MNAGRVEQVDEPDRLYCTPRSLFVADFIGKINLLNCHVLKASGDGLRLEVAGLGEVTAPPAPDIASGRSGALGLRPELVNILGQDEVTEAAHHFPGRVRELLYHGDITLYTVELADGRLLRALKPNSAPGRAKFFETGDAVTIAWRHDVGIFLGD